MPGGDGTGPAGMGSMTGRGMGFCAGLGAPGYTSGGGRGFRGWGRGGGAWGRRNWLYATGLTGWQRAAMGGPGLAEPGSRVPSFVPTVPQQPELDLLKGQAEYFEDALDGIKRRIEELEGRAKKT